VRDAPPPSPIRRGSIAALCLLLLGVGLALRLELLPWHQNVWGVDWLAYYEPQARHLRSLWLPGWALSWEGLHPPLSGMLHGGAMVLGASQWAHWGATLSASLLAPLLLGLALARRSTIAALLLLLAFAAISPLQVNYGLNTSPYPWALLLLASSTAALLAALDSEDVEPWLWAAVLGALAAQVHVLALAAVGAQYLVVLASLRGGARKPRALWLGLVTASALVVIAGSVLRTSDPWTFHIGEGEESWTRQVLHALQSRFVPEGASRALGALGVGGAVSGLVFGPRKVPVLLIGQAAAWLGALALFYSLHVADPRLTHYFVVPQLLLAGAAVFGVAAAQKAAGRWLGLLPVAIALGIGVLWGGSAHDWHQSKSDAAEQAIAASAAEPVRALYEEAGPGDVVAYLWGYRFLNDEPEYLDPVAARWPTWRLGRPCFDIEQPRQRCNAHGGARFWFSPSDYSGDMESQEEELRIMINGARAPGQATLIVLPGEDPPARPWPLEGWLEENGAESLGPLQGGVMLYRFAPGARIPDPPPLHPGEEPPEDPED
jgi:hypothetical protein